MEGIFRNIMITKYIESKCEWIKSIPEISPGDHGFSMITSGGVETEIGEFIYSLVKLIKPNYVLETGTHYGLSSSYIGLALKDNSKGKITTLDPYVYEDVSKKTWTALELNDYIEFKQVRSLEFTVEHSIDLLFLDSEPCYRFDEFVKFFDNVVPGGIIMIHDLHPHLSYNEAYINNMQHWPYGDFRKTLGPFIKDNLVQTFSFNTPRGFTIFQKSRSDFSHFRYLKSEL